MDATSAERAIGSRRSVGVRTLPFVDRALLMALSGALLLLFARVGIRPVSDPDSWLHLRIGTFLNEGGRFEQLPDPWSAGAVRVYVPTQWLPERLGATAFDMAGLPAIALMRSAAALGLLLALLWLCRQVADPVPASIAAVATLVGCAGALAERPQAFAVSLLAVITAGWWGTVREGRPRWWIIPLSWLLAMSHGLWVIAVVVGFVFTVVVIVDHRDEWRRHLRLCAIPLASIAAAALTPLGPSLLSSPFQVRATVGDYVQEWQPVTTTNPLFLVAATLTAVTVILWMTSSSPVRLSRALILLASITCVLWSGRTIVVGAILLAGLLAEALQMHRQTAPDTRPSPFERLHWGLTGVLIAAICIILAPRVAQEPQGVPMNIDTALASLPQDTVILAAHELSGWVMWEAPHTRVVFDLRSEIYDREQIEGYVDALAARPGWSPFVDESTATHALLATDSPLTEALRRADWDVQVRDNEYVLLAAPSPAAPTQ